MTITLQIWVCPECHRTFREHVFGEGTSMSGPLCNTCCVPLEPKGKEIRKSEPVLKPYGIR